jgi:hypothetical protein
MESNLDNLNDKAHKQSVYLLKKTVSECLVYFKEKLSNAITTLHTLDVHLPSLFTEGNVSESIQLDFSGIPGI